MVERKRALVPTSKYSVAQLGRNRGGEFAERLAVLDEDVEVLGGIGIERRSQDAAVAQRARAELHAAVHPGHDLVVVQLRHGGSDQFVHGEHVAEAQLAVFEHLLDFGARCRRGPGRGYRAARAASWRQAPCQVSSTAPMAVPALPEAGCTNTFSKPERFSSAETSSAFRPRPPARHRLRPLPAMRITAASTAFWMPAATCGRRSSGIGCAVLQSEPLVESRAETAAVQALGAEEGAVEARSGIGKAEDLQEQIAITAVAAHGEPLHLVLVHVGVEAQQLGDAAVEIAEGIGGILFVFERHARAAGLPARAAAEVAAAVEREDRGFLEWRGVVGRGGMRQVVLQHHDAALGEARAQLEVKIGFGDGAHDGHRIHLLAAWRRPVPGTWRWNARAARRGRPSACGGARAWILRWRRRGRRLSGWRWRRRRGFRRCRE